MLIFKSFTNQFSETSEFTRCKWREKDCQRIWKRKIEEEFLIAFWKVNKEEKSICDYHHYKTAVWYNIKISTIFEWNKPYLSLELMLTYLSDDFSRNQRRQKQLYFVILIENDWKQSCWNPLSVRPGIRSSQ